MTERFLTKPYAAYLLERAAALIWPNNYTLNFQVPLNAPTLRLVYQNLEFQGRCYLSDPHAGGLNIVRYAPA